MDGMNGSRERSSGQVVRAFHSAARGSRFGQAESRVPDLSDRAQRGQPGAAYDPQMAYLMSVVSGWAYSDGQTLADKMQHYGFERGAHVQEFSVVNDAMLVVVRAYLVRSEDGRTGILAFRGTQPVNAINWLANADTMAREFHGRGVVHHGFHACVEALWSYIEAALHEAVNAEQPLEQLYVTGHSLGGAMALLAAAKIFCDEAVPPAWRRMIRGVYTFGQPQVGDAQFASACGDLDNLVYRHEYRHDVVPGLPPSSIVEFTHMGEKRVCGSRDEPWRVSNRPTRPLRYLVQALACVSASFFTRRFLRLRGLDGLWRSLDDHHPQHYINTCKRSLRAVAQPEAAIVPGPIERVKRMAHTAAEAGKVVLMRTRRGTPAAPQPPA